jgi:hypothetical protein
MLVRCPPSTPAGLLELLRLWEEFKGTPEYTNMTEASREKSEARVAAKTKEHDARAKCQRALMLVDLDIAAKRLLSVKDKKLLGLLRDGTLAREAYYSRRALSESGEMTDVAACVPTVNMTNHVVL